jgi:hypothetical protein
MKTRQLLFTLFFTIVCPIGALAQSSVPVSGMVAPDSTTPALEVRNMALDFRFAGYGVYIPSKYPRETSIPLENGERIALEKMSEMKLEGTRVRWKKYIPPAERVQYDHIDEQGYYHWSDVEVDVVIRDWKGSIIRSRIKRPANSDVYLVGETDRGDYELQLDQENNKTVIIAFTPAFIMQCTQDPTHVFPNQEYKYCPRCGGLLKRIERPRP